MARTRKQRRVMLLIWGLLALGASAALAFTALRSSLVFYVGPAEAAEKFASGEIGPDRRVRVGGRVVPDSVVHGRELSVEFVIGDGAGEMTTRYVGVLPDLFAEGQGVIAEGYLRDGWFQADEVLAKHDENYMPREVAEQLKRNGEWRGDAPYAAGGTE